MPLNLARRHPAGIHRQDLVVKPREPRLMLRHDLRLERAAAVPRRLKLHLAEVALQLLLRRAVPAVAAVVAGRVVPAVPKVLIELGIHRPLEQRLRELLQQPVFANNLLRLLVVAQQLIDQLWIDAHRVLHSVSMENIVYTICFTPSSMTGVRAQGSAVATLLEDPNGARSRG